MTVRFVNATGASGDVCSVPAGIQPGDILIFTENLGTATNFAPTAGIWTQIPTTGTPASYWHLATASEPSSYTCASAGNQASSIIAYRGCDPLAPVRTESRGSGTSNSPAGPTVTAVIGDMLVVIVVDTQTGNVDITAAPSGMTLRDKRKAVSIYTMGTFDEPVTVSGATGSKVATLGQSDNWATISFLLKSGSSTPGGLIYNS